MMREHVVFYDGDCPFCHFWVRTLIHLDKKNLFAFASLQGKTAQRELGNIRGDSLVLLQDYGSDKEKTLIEGKAVLRIFWLLGGAWIFVGMLSFLPSFLFDWFYRVIARNRMKLFTSCKMPLAQSHPNRFLD